MKKKKITIGYIIRAFFHTVFHFIIPIVLVLSPFVITGYTVFSTPICRDLETGVWNIKNTVVYGFLTFIVTTMIAIFLGFIIMLLTSKDDEDQYYNYELDDEKLAELDTDQDSP